MVDIPIIFEDESIIVIDKPAGMVVNKAESAKGLTVQVWAENRLNLNEYKVDVEDILDKEFFSRGGVVHRLDKETSGILIIAKNKNSFENLKNQFKDRETGKKYIALAHGKIEPKEGEVDMPIGRLPWNRTRFGVLPEGREAKTLYKVVEYRTLNEKTPEALTLVELYPKTGRTHQIRVHLRHLGFPIYADILYSGRKQAKRDRKNLSRHFLHASELTFKHPMDGREMKIESNLASELSEFLAKTEVTE